MNPTQYSADFLLDVAASANMPPFHPSNDCGHILFDARDGWKVEAFYDVGDFDYIEHFVAPDGEVIDPWEWEMGEDPHFNPEREKIIWWRVPDKSTSNPAVYPLLHQAIVMEVSRRILLQDWLDGLFSKSIPIASTPLGLEAKPTLSPADIRSIATEIVDALDDPNFYFGSREVGIVTDLLTRRLIKEGEAA